MRVAFLPNRLTRISNPYLDLLENGLRSKGVLFEDEGSDYLSWKRLFLSRHKVDLFHFHWIDYHYLGSSASSTTYNALKFVAKLILARWFGYRIVFTLHNLFPHERPYPCLDVLVRRVMLWVAHSVIVHCETGRDLLEKEFGRKDVNVIPLGNYIDVHPGEISRTEARVRLGIPKNDIVFLYFGLIRPYKGIERFLQVSKSLTNEQYQIWIVGQPQDHGYEEKIRSVANNQPKVHLHLEFIPDHQVSVFFKAADVVVLPFTQVLTSSSAMLALSFGCPVIAPAIGCLPELVTPECGFLYDLEADVSLKKALSASLTSDLSGMKQSAYLRAEEFTWEETARLTLLAYQGINHD